jgi:hypothetical protein
MAFPARRVVVQIRVRHCTLVRHGLHEVKRSEVHVELALLLVIGRDWRI